MKTTEDKDNEGGSRRLMQVNKDQTTTLAAVREGSTG